MNGGDRMSLWGEAASARTHQPTMTAGESDAQPPRDAEPRNGFPAVRPYHWRPGDAERDAEVAGRLAAIRAHLAGTP